jgi:hypothetical protein
MARYSPSGVPTSDLANTQRWLREEMEGVRQSTDDIYALADFSIDTYTVAGYGGIGQNAASAPLADVNATFTTLNTFDIPLIVPRGVAYSFPNDSMALEFPGVWYQSIKVTLEHNELNAGRVIALRTLNLTTGTPSGVVFRYGVARNVAVSNLTLGAFFEVAEDRVGDEIVLQLGTDGDVFTAVNCIGAIYEVHSISEYKGDFQVEAQQKRKI